MKLKKFLAGLKKIKLDYNLLLKQHLIVENAFIRKEGFDFNKIYCFDIYVYF